MNIIDNTKKQINELITNACEKARIEGKLPPGELLTGMVEIPRENIFGDFAAILATLSSNSSCFLLTAYCILPDLEHERNA